MEIESLSHGWSLRAVAGAVPERIADTSISAVVPGTVHTDLLAAGLIPDPYLGTNEEALAWLHHSAWRYDLDLRTAPAASDERIDLALHGVDTIATITLDGTELGRTANMHRTYRYDIRDLLSAGGNRLSVRFDPALTYAERIDEQLGTRPHTNTHPYNAVRKMACSFGWDWGPDLQTAGLWRPVTLERWRVARLASVRPLATLDADGRTGRLTVHAEIERAGLGEDRELEIRVRLSQIPEASGHARVPAGQNTAVIDLKVPDAPVWWPSGHGEQPLVPLTVELAEAHSSTDLLDSFKRRIGFRSIRLYETPDGDGTRFALVVNGRPLFIKGLNWIPQDHLLTRLTRDDYTEAINSAVAAHANLLRVWGGGIYESRDFYEVCDERGLLVWQDFALACAAYAEEDPLRTEILAEARENVSRLSPHPSLVVWNGGNENLWGHEDWGWKEQLGGRTWGARYYYEDFPAILAELDPSRPYHPGSPSSPGFPPEQVHPNDDRHGTRHEWDVWNRLDYRHHLDHIPRFCSEFGWQAPPNWATLTRAMETEQPAKGSPAFLIHQKALDGTGKLDRGLAHHFDVPDDFTDWHWATQLNQARATAFAIEHLRSWWPRTMGSILWQLNDCWPVTSWAVIDGDGRFKPAWYALRRAYAPRLLTFQPRDGGLRLVVVNDTDEPWQDTVRVRRLSFDGRQLAAEELRITTAHRENRTLPLPDPLLAVGDPAREVLVADADGLRAVYFFAEDRDLAYDPDPVETTVSSYPGGYHVTIAAASLARDVTVLADRVAPDAMVDDQLITVLPGEQHTFFVCTDGLVDADALTGPQVLRHANRIALADRGRIDARRRRLG
ncbi:glycoside hydrolase family 2 protein [Streptomyces brasiliensis]|uniref:beta-mannosidase n=1 Tax=Streptomyces brasiliensis TaxID=1954 RepID=A0A917UL60_9ACTN|nr:glycoside hydrolase family 2 TIM barrel-domain containing protein [Streptomyces brasiliensis]GGJ65908.1 beta-mannosidase [Streptomyces brasiliensis]